MAQNVLVEKSLLEKIQDLVERKPGHCDVAFSVGKEKKIVRALKVILKASSPFLEKEFDDKWDTAVIKEGEGIPLPDFDPTAFELFVKLTSLDTWSLEVLKALNLQPNQILNLLSICRSFEVKAAVETLEKVAATFMQSFGEYKVTYDFLRLSQKNLKCILVSDEIEIKELDVFHAAMRWAEFQCKDMKVEPSEEHIREVLGDCLFEIRFPIMTNTEFTKAIDSKDILTAQETIGIYKFIGLETNKKLEFNTKKLPFKITPRKATQALESKPNPNTNHSEGLVPPGISTVSLTRDSQIVGNPPFVCNGSKNYHYIACAKKIAVFGLGFWGPIETDGFYDVKVHFEGHLRMVYDSGILEKRIFAQKGKKFHFVFDVPIDLEAADSDQWDKNYVISYYLKGPNTSAVTRCVYNTFVVQGGDIKFRSQWKSNQLAEILFKVL